MRRLDGVGKVNVSLEEGAAVLTPKPGRSFDPTGISKAVKNAGFTPEEVRFTVRGKLVRHEKFLALDVPGLQKLLVLERGPGAEQLRKSEVPEGYEITVTGRLHASHGDEPPGMTVEKFVTGPSPARVS